MLSTCYFLIRLPRSLLSCTFLVFYLVLVRNLLFIFHQLALDAAIVGDMMDWSLDISTFVRDNRNPEGRVGLSIGRSPKLANNKLDDLLYNSKEQCSFKGSFLYCTVPDHYQEALCYKWLIY